MKLAAPTEEDREMASRYAQVFLGTDAGRAVLADLRKHYGIGRPRFVADERGNINHATAAKIDGECAVMLHVELAIALGAPGKGLSQLSNPTPTQPNP